MKRNVKKIEINDKQRKLTYVHIYLLAYSLTNFTEIKEKTMKKTKEHERYSYSLLTYLRTY